MYRYIILVSLLLQNYIARFGHGSAKLARQAQSKEKTLKKMIDGGLAEKVTVDKVGYRFMYCTGCAYKIKDVDNLPLCFVKD